MLLMLIGLMLVGCGNKQEKFIKDALGGHEWNETDNQYKAVGDLNKDKFLGQEVIRQIYDNKRNTIRYVFIDKSHTTVNENGPLSLENEEKYELLYKKISNIFGDGEKERNDELYNTIIGEHNIKRSVWYYDTYKITLEASFKKGSYSEHYLGLLINNDNNE